MSATFEGGEKIRKTLENLSKGLPNAVNDAVQESLNKGRDHSVGVVHVITGALRDSIRIEMLGQGNGDLVAGGEGGVDYAIYEELGNSYREGHPYLQPGFEIATRDVLNNVKKKVDGLKR